ncbi:Leucine-rich repeat receptor-like protein kinase pxc1, partial [Thalictrum thalictroides]
LPGSVITQNDPASLEYYLMETDSLFALKADFNHPLLENNWTGLHCLFSDQPQWYGIRCFNGRVTEIILEDIGLTGKVKVHALDNLTELSSISFRNNVISGNLMHFTYNSKLKHIDLSDNMFDGIITSSLLGLNVLESLQLQDNNLTGPIPAFNQPSLTRFNVSNNNLSGEIPQTRALRSFDVSSYLANPGLCGSPLLTKCGGRVLISDNAPPARKKKKFGGASLVAIFVVLDVIGLAIVVFLFYAYCRRAKRQKKEKQAHELELETENTKKDEKLESAPATTEDGKKLTFLNEVEHFELRDLYKASAEGLGKGNFGNVYKATLDNGLAVVVKRLKNLKPLSDDEFNKQVRVLADLKHPNLLPPLAYYYSNDEKLMVYKFVQNGNLFNRIFGGRGKERIPFKWNSRVLVAHGVARALEFLHLNTKSQTSIPHGNLKSSNILLDANGMAIVSDYGLASLVAVPISTQRMISYKCPEYQMSKKISKKSDVWCYGTFLLELLTGKISTYSAPQGINGVDLGTWVHKAVREEWTAEIFDMEIARQRNAFDGMFQLLQVALKCCDKSPEKRPDMNEVVRQVEEIRVGDSDDDSDLSVSFDEQSKSFDGRSF